MQIAVLVLFCINLSLLLLHEMDAIRHQEWKMFIVLKSMPNDKAYRAFLLLHLPLYAAVMFLLLGQLQWLGFVIVDGFLLLHAVIHLMFRNHQSNNLNGALSKILIYTMAVLSAVHLICLWFL